jgi:hypothetical protein
MSVKSRTAAAILLIAALPAPALAAPAPDPAPHAPAATPDPMPPAEPAGDTGAQAPAPVQSTPQPLQSTPAPADSTPAPRPAESPLPSPQPATPIPEDTAPPPSATSAVESQPTATRPARRPTATHGRVTVTPTPRRREPPVDTAAPFITVPVRAAEESPLVPAAAALLILALASGSFVMLAGRVGRFGNS